MIEFISSILLSALAGAAIYRARGMGLWRLPRPLWQLAFSVAYGVVAFTVAPWWVALFVLAVTVGAISTGHASYMDLGSVPLGASYAPKDGRPDEWYGAWIPGSGYWHEFAGLAVSGILISASCGLALCLAGDYLTGITVIVSGALKAPAYAIAWWFHRRWDVEPISLGETLTGAVLWGALALLAW